MSINNITEEKNISDLSMSDQDLEAVFGGQEEIIDDERYAGATYNELSLGNRLKPSNE